MESDLTNQECVDPLDELLSMPLSERIAAIAKDVRTKRDKFRPIDPHKLADALDVPQPESPTNDWIHTTYAEIRRVEEYAEELSPVSEMVFLIREKVTAKRFEFLEKQFEQLDSQDEPSFDFLRPNERRALERALALEELKGNQENGMSCIARYAISVRGGPLWFEGDIEDDGRCIFLRTPYDERDGEFKDLDNCVTDSW